jgi:hypothetical protein
MGHNYELLSVLAAIAVAAGLQLIARIRDRAAQLNGRKRALRQINNFCVAFLVLCCGLWLSLSFAGIRTLSTPGDTLDIATPEQLLRHIQAHNESIQRLSNTLYWLLLTGVLWIGWSVVPFLRKCQQTSPNRDGDSAQGEDA